MKELTHLIADQIRTLVGVPINLHHRNDQIIELFDNKITKYESKLLECKLMSTDILFGFQRYWWPSLKYSALVLSLDCNSNILARLHAVLLPKLRVMRTFPIIMRSVPAYLGGLNLR